MGGPYISSNIITAPVDCSNMKLGFPKSVRLGDVWFKKVGDGMPSLIVLNR